MASDQGSAVTFNASPSQGGSIGSTPLSVNYGVQGAGVQQLPAVTNGASWFGGQATMEMPDLHLPDFLNAVAAPGLEEQKQQQMWDGFVAARGGMAQKDIDESQPWYTKVFGPTNYQLGAATYTAMDKTATAENDILQRMPELRKLSPGDMAKEMNRVNGSMMTGDGYADAIIQKTFMDRAGPMMDLYHKESVAWQQQDLMNKQLTAFGSAAGAYEAQARAQAQLGDQQPMDPKVVDQQQESLRNLLDVITPSANQTDQSIKAITTTAIKQMVTNGQWHTYHALEKLGVMKHLDADDQEKLQEFVDKQENRARLDYAADPASQEMLARIAFTSAAGIGGKPTWDMMKQFNDRFRATTGIDQDYFTTQQTSEKISQSTTAHLHAQERADEKMWSYQFEAYKHNLTINQADQKRDATVAAGVQGFRSANLGQLKQLPGSDDQLLNSGAWSAYQEDKLKDPAKAMTTLVNAAVTGVGAVLPQMKEDIATRASVATIAPSVNQAFVDLYTDWKQMTTTKATHYNGKDGSQSVDNGEGGQAAAASYFGPELNKRMQDFDTMVKGNASSELAYDTVFGKSSLNYSQQVLGVDQARTQAINSAIADQIHDLGKRGTIMGWFHDDNMTDAAADQSLRLIRRYLNSNAAAGGAVPETQVLAAMKMAQADGNEFTGRYAIDNKGLRPVYQWKGWGTDNGEVSPQVSSQIVNRAAEIVAAKHGFPATGPNMNLLRMQDGPNGEPTLQLWGLTDDGWKFAQFGAKELKEAQKYISTVQKNPLPGPGFIRNPDGTVSESALRQPML